MTETNSWTLELPKEPCANIVLIKNISTETKEATIKDFFSFCGTIKEFEIKLDVVDEKHQVALVYFEKESAAKTATLLSQAVVDDSPIQVELFYKQEEPIIATDKEIPTLKESSNKSVSHVMTELLASGYILTESVIAKGAEFDEKHGVSTRMNGYLNKVGINLTSLNQRFVGGSGGVIVKEDSTTPNPPPQGRMQNLMKSKTGLKVQGIASRVVDKVSNVHEEAKRIAAEKKKDSFTSA